MDKIIGMGNALVDVLVTLPDDSLLKQMKLPKGSMQLIDDDRYIQIKSVFDTMHTERSTGGSAGNTVKALAALNVQPGFIGKIGPDAMGDFFCEDGIRRGIDMKLLKSKTYSGVASTFITPDGERTFATHLGAAHTMHAEDLYADLFRGYTYLYIEGYLVQDHDLILRAMQLAKDEELQVCLDMASYNIVAENIDFFKFLICRYVDVVFANEEEAKALTGKEVEDALDEISSQCSIVIVKLGAKGSVIKKGTEMVQIHTSQEQHVVDTTGAGDFYAAGFLYGLINGYSLNKCGMIGTVLASAVIKSVGTTLPKHQWDEIKLNIEELVQG